MTVYGCVVSEWRRVCEGGCVKEGVWRVCGGGCVEGMWRRVYGEGCVEEGVQVKACKGVNQYWINQNINSTIKLQHPYSVS